MLNKPLRLAMLSVHSCPVGHLGGKDTGGMNVYVRELARELGKQGHSVDVYTRVHDRTDSQMVQLGENARLIHVRAGGMNIHKLAMYHYLPEFALNMERFRNDNNLQYDMIFSHYWLSGRVGMTLSDWWDIPNMTMFHTLGAIKNSLDIGENEPELRVETERYLIHHTPRIIAATEKEKAQMMARYGARQDTVGIVPCGVNLDLFHPVDKQAARKHVGFDENSKVILFVGRIEPLKGIENLVQSIALLKNKSNIKLMIIGGDAKSKEQVTALQKMAGELGVQDAVTFLGLVKQERLPYFYSAADVCVVPSYYESFGLVALESLACGTPVVTNDVGDVSNIIRPGETGYVIPDNSPQQIAEKVDLLLSRRYQHDSNVVRGCVERFGWANIATMIGQQCQDVILATKEGTLATAGCCQ